MTDPTGLTLPLPVHPMAIDATAFRRAVRHSRHVRLLRAAMIGGVVVLVGGIAVVTIFDPFHKLPAGISIDSTSLSGSKVTMANPKLAGYHQDGRPYEISASSAVQDIKAPTLFELHDLKARLTMADKTLMNVTARLGSYNSTDEIMNLTTEVHIVSNSGLDMKTQDAHVEFKTSSVSTEKPVSVEMRGSSVQADTMHVVDGGKQVTFAGHVHSVMQPNQQVAEGEAAASGTAP